MIKTPSFFVSHNSLFPGSNSICDKSSKYLELLEYIRIHKIQNKKFSRFMAIINSQIPGLNLNLQDMIDSFEQKQNINHEINCISITLLQYYYGSHQECDWN
jgi:hypothetical protein